jgi:conjugative relaxase-like TrwC/TraI family protein
MSLAKLSAGDGYAYLTRQVAAADDTNRGYGTLGAYYEEKGEAPGVWLGSGLGSCPSIVPGIPLLAAGSRVSEAQMTALFGEGRHPDADLIEDRLRSSGLRDRDLDRATRLGQKYPIHDTPNVFRERLAAAYRDHNQRFELPPGAPIHPEIRARLRTGLATQMFTEEHHRPPSDTRELSGFLARASRPAPVAVAGYDLTFSPVKSVSTLWAIAPLADSDVIAACHKEAVENAIAWLEKTACFTRRGAHGVAQVETTGFLAAAFTHRDSRAGDPDLHTHVAISNKVCTPDGQWLALDGRALYKNKVAASERYNTRLEALLVERLGVRFAERGDGPAGKRSVREIVGIDGADGKLPRMRSSRRTDIESALAELTSTFQREHGRPATTVETLALAQQATLATRDPKHASRSVANDSGTGQVSKVWLGRHRPTGAPVVALKMKNA